MACWYGMRASPYPASEQTSRVPTVCRIPTTAEFQSDRAKSTVGSSNGSVMLPHWMSDGKNAHSSPVISGSVDRALRTIR